MWTKQNMPDLTGKTAIVTGANTGIGYEMAKALFEAGADVTIASRNSEKANAALHRVKNTTTGSGKLEIGILNLASLQQIKSFADSYASKHQQLDILINNAGVMIPPASTTDDGFELQFGVNFLGHFALTGHLFPLLQKAAEARVVTLSSGAAIRATGIDFDNLRLEKGYDDWREYAISKLADIIFTNELNRKIEAAGFNIKAVSGHPGVTRTDLQRHIPNEQLQGLFAQFDTVMEPWQGALPALFAATDVSVKGGEFYGLDDEKEYAGYPALSRHSTTPMHDLALASRLWEYATEATQVSYPC